MRGNLLWTGDHLNCRKELPQTFDGNLGLLPGTRRGFSNIFTIAKFSMTLNPLTPAMMTVCAQSMLHLEHQSDGLVVQE